MHILRLYLHRLYPWLPYAYPFVQVLGGYSPFPIWVTMQITTACNLDCEMCCLKLYDVPNNAPYVDRMRFEDFVKILANLEQSFPIKPRLCITGGEPSLHREFLPMIRHAVERGFSCAITSNGALIEQAADGLVTLGLTDIMLSVDGIGEVHNRIRGRGDSYARAVAAARAIRAARDRARLDSPMLLINCVITGHNYHQLVDMIDFTYAVGGDYLTFQHLMYMEGTPFAEHHIEDIDLLISQLETARQLAWKKNVRVRLFPRMPMESLKHYYLESVADDSLNCVQPWLRACIIPNGDVLFCYYSVVTP